MQATGGQLESQQSSGTVRDESRVWDEIAAAQHKLDGLRAHCQNRSFCLLQVTGAQLESKQSSGTIRDESRVWENIAAAQYKLDGDDAGWDSEESDQETEDDKYIKVRLLWRVAPQSTLASRGKRGVNSYQDAVLRSAS